MCRCCREKGKLPTATSVLLHELRNINSRQHSCDIIHVRTPGGPDTNEWFDRDLNLHSVDSKFGIPAERITTSNYSSSEDSFIPRSRDASLGKHSSRKKPPPFNHISTSVFQDKSGDLFEEDDFKAEDTVVVVKTPKYPPSRSTSKTRFKIPQHRAPLRPTTPPALPCRKTRVRYFV